MSVFREFTKQLDDEDSLEKYWSYINAGAGPLQDENLALRKRGAQEFLDQYQEGLDLHAKLKPTRDKALAHFSLEDFEKAIVKDVIDMACVTIALNDALHLAILATDRDGMTVREDGYRDTAAMLAKQVAVE